MVFRLGSSFLVITSVKFSIFYIGFLVPFLTANFKQIEPSNKFHCILTELRIQFKGSVIVRGEICLFQFVTLLYIDIY